jgi:hypothetical protein
LKLSSRYLYEQLSKTYEILECRGLSERDGYLRPFFYDGTEKELQSSGGQRAPKDRVWVVPQELTGRFSGSCKGLAIYCETSKSLPPKSDSSSVETIGDSFGVSEQEKLICIRLVQKDGSGAAGVLNDLQRIFDRCEEWNSLVVQMLAENAGIGKILNATYEFLGNPLMVMGLDFSLLAQAGEEQLPERGRLFTPDGINIEMMNALLQDKSYQKLAEERETVIFPAYISGCRSMNCNLYVEGQPLYRLVMSECSRPLTGGDVCILETLAAHLEYLLAHESAASMEGDLEQVFRRIMTEKAADYMQISRRLSALGWGAEHNYLCLVLQITYLNQKQLSTKTICRYIKRQFPDSVSFLYQEEIVAFFDLSRLGLGEEEVSEKLVYFIRDSYLKAGYSRTIQGHMNLRRQYVQARMALDVGSRRRPYVWIHHFNQIVLPYLMEQATRRLPGTMLCHEGLLKLCELDDKNHTDYVQTLKVYLEQHMSATQAARALFIHRSTFLYRLDRIREILQSDLEDADEIFYLELSLRLLEQEEVKNT